jgi:hypothetical protein
MSNERDKGSGKIDWETHSLRYVINAIGSAQKRQQKLWSQLAATRTGEGLISVDWPLIEEYVESVRRTYCMMIDLETVGAEYEGKFGKTGRPRAKAKPTARTRAPARASKPRVRKKK